MTKNSFLNIDNINEANRDKLLEIRQALFASLIRHVTDKECQSRYLISLAVLIEFERVTRHITEPAIIKN